MLNELVGECRLLVEALPSPHAHSLLEVDRGTRERKKGASERRKRERKGRERETKEGARGKRERECARERELSRCRHTRTRAQMHDILW